MNPVVTESKNQINRITKTPHLIHRLASPNYFYQVAGQALPWLALAGLLLFCTGVVWGLAFAPADYQQGDSFRIIYVHVPAAAFSMGVYVAMAIAGGIGLRQGIRLGDFPRSILSRLLLLGSFRFERGEGGFQPR